MLDSLICNTKNFIPLEDIIFEGMSHEETMQFEEIEIKDSENELEGDKLEAPWMLFFLKEWKCFSEGSRDPTRVC